MGVVTESRRSPPLALRYEEAQRDHFPQMGDSDHLDRIAGVLNLRRCSAPRAPRCARDPPSAPSLPNTQTHAFPKIQFPISHANATAVPPCLDSAPTSACSPRRRLGLTRFFRPFVRQSGNPRARSRRLRGKSLPDPILLKIQSPISESQHA